MRVQDMIERGFFITKALCLIAERFISLIIGLLHLCNFAVSIQLLIYHEPNG